MCVCVCVCVCACVCVCVCVCMSLTEVPALCGVLCICASSMFSYSVLYNNNIYVCTHLYVSILFVYRLKEGNDPSTLKNAEDSNFVT